MGAFVCQLCDCRVHSLFTVTDAAGFRKPRRNRLKTLNALAHNWNLPEPMPSTAAASAAAAGGSQSRPTAQQQQAQQQAQQAQQGHPGAQHAQQSAANGANQRYMDVSVRFALCLCRCVRTALQEYITVTASELPHSEWSN